MSKQYIVSICMALVLAVSYSSSQPIYGGDDEQWLIATGALAGAFVGWIGNPKQDSLNVKGILLGAAGGAALGYGVSEGIAEEIVNGAIDVTPYTMGAGALYGAAQGIFKKKDLFEGLWTGVTVGAVAPGLIGGAAMGTAIGTVVSLAKSEPFKQRHLVGWGGSGAGGGGSVTMIMGGAAVGDVAGAAVSLAYLGYTQYRGMKIGKSFAKKNKGVSDAIAHQKVMGEVRSRYGGGVALIGGSLKEGLDYFSGKGNPELRDLQNNWNGIFRQPGYY